MKSKGKRRISWMLVAFLIVGMFTGVQPFGVQEVMASDAVRGLVKKQQEGNFNFSVEDLDGKLKLSNDAGAGGGFRSEGITNTSYLVMPEKYDGDFSVEANLTIDKIASGNSYVVGVGAFNGIRDEGLLFSAVARGKNNAIAYHSKTSGYGTGGKTVDTTTMSAISLKIERNSGEYTAWINGKRSIIRYGIK